MSAFVVTDATITGILQAFTPEYAGDGAFYYHQDEAHYIGGHEAEVAQKLVDENYRSVNYRYNEAGQAHKFQRRTIRSLTAVEIIKLCDCYEYQACETSDWRDTEAAAILAVAKSRAIRRLPGYSSANWSMKDKEAGIGY